MKKLILILMGIFLISFISATITVYKPNDPVTNLQATNISGTMPAGNYQIRIVVLGTMSPSTQRYSSQQRSPPSNLVNITLDAPGGISLNWTNATDGYSKRMYIYVMKDDSTWRVNTQAPEGVSGVTGEEYNLTEWITSPYGTPIWGVDSNTPDPPVPYGLDSWQGIGLVKVTGDAGSLYFVHIVSAIKTAYGGTLPNSTYYNDFYTFAGFWSIDTYSATSGSLTISAWDLWLMAWYNGNNFQIKSTKSSTYKTAMAFPMYAGSSTFIYFGNADLNQVTIHQGATGMDSTYWGSMQSTNNAYTFLKGSIVSYAYPKVYSATGFQNSLIYCGEVLIFYCGNEASPIIDTSIMSGSIRYYKTYCGVNNLTFRNLYTSGTYSFDINSRQNTASASRMKVIDSIFEGRSDNIPTIYWYNYGYNSPILVGNSFNVLVTDENGDEITGANVTLTNEDGTIFSVLTSSDGNITEQFAYHHHINRTASGNGYSDDIQDKNPYNLTVTKTNYEDYVVTNFNISDKIDWVVTLESRDWNYSKSLAWKILNLTGTTILKLSDEGNLAIAGELYENTNTAPNNIIYKVENLFWLTRTGDLYLVKELMELI